jgi:oxaloacetate decarboxylase gamma subunit
MIVYWYFGIDSHYYFLWRPYDDSRNVRAERILALLGMGVVFSFLIILIVFMTLVAKIIHALGWDADFRRRSKFLRRCRRSLDDNAAVIAAVTAAVNEHRKNNA